MRDTVTWKDDACDGMALYLVFCTSEMKTGLDRLQPLSWDRALDKIRTNHLITEGKRTCLADHCRSPWTVT